MTLKLKLFYRKKGKATALAGKTKGITTDILTLPEPNNLIKQNFSLVSHLSEEKMQKIKQKLECIDKVKNKDGKDD